jgi:hypothetical protein
VRYVDYRRPEMKARAHAVWKTAKKNLGTLKPETKKERTRQLRLNVL